MDLTAELERRFGPLDEAWARHALLRALGEPRSLALRLPATGDGLTALRLPAIQEAMTNLGAPTYWRLLDQDRRKLDDGLFRLLLPTMGSWPAGLSAIGHPPALLYLRGDLAGALSRPAVAIVGSRECTPYGGRIARTLAGRWATLGGTVVSGGARGLDALAHQASLENGGPSVAVLGTGIDVLYPARNRELLSRCAGQGALLSELPPGTPARPYNFPWRNRLIVGLAPAVIIVQAGRRSGALITATFALKSGKKLFTVPAPVDEELFAGGLDLLESGARAMTGEDCLVRLFQELSGACGGKGMLFPPAAPPPAPVSPKNITGGTHRLLRLLAGGATHMDDLAAQLELDHAAVSLLLLELELKGWVTREPGNHFRSHVRLEKEHNG